MAVVRGKSGEVSMVALSRRWTKPEKMGKGINEDERIRLR
jgi:hypothetical protein